MAVAAEVSAACKSPSRDPMVQLKAIPHSRGLRLHLSLGAFVVMLDHWHALSASFDGKTISLRMRILGRWLSRKTGENNTRSRVQEQ